MTRGSPGTWHARLAQDTAWTNATLKAAATGDEAHYITDIMVSNGATAATFSILDGSGGTVLYKVPLAINGNVHIKLSTPLKLSKATAVALTSSVASVGAFVGVAGFTARSIG